MTGAHRRALAVAVFAGLTLFPVLVTRMTAPGNHGAHGLTTGFGRGRLDLQGIVSEGSGTIALPPEPMALTVRVSGGAPLRIVADGAQQDLGVTAVPVSVRLDLPRGGPVRIESASRFRLHDLVIERAQRSGWQVGVLVLLGLAAIGLALRGPAPAAGAAVALLAAFTVISSGTLSWTFARIALVQMAPALSVVLLLAPLALALKLARFTALREASRLTRLAFASSLALTAASLMMFEPPLALGDPGAYLEMGGRFADALARLGSPLGLGPILADVQPYLALPATGLLYGLLLLPGVGPGLIYAVQALSMAFAVAALVSICESEIGPRAGKIGLLIALLHPSFTILPGIVQPEPFILAAWTLAAKVALSALRERDQRGLLAAGVLLGVGLSLHPQGLSFLLLAFVLCLLPWGLQVAREPRSVLALALGIFSVLLPVAAAEHFSKPLAHVLDKEYGFFAYTSPHPLGFWLYVDSDGWQGPLRIEDTTYQKELFAIKGPEAVSSNFGDVAQFAARHLEASAQTVLTNLHRLWHQPDNPFAVAFPLPYEIQILLHRGLVVLFVLSLPALLGGRLAILALPFVMLSMTYPAYHVFNKYATPALPFTIIGATLALDRIIEGRRYLRLLIAGLGAAAFGALLPASWFARVGVSGDLFLLLVRGLLWVGLGVALGKAVQVWGSDGRAKVLGGVVGLFVLLLASLAAARTDTNRSAWSEPLDRPFEATCSVLGLTPSDDPAWLLFDIQSADGTPPRVEVNGRLLKPLLATMPTYGLATVRGHRDPAAFRQIWRASISDEMLATGLLHLRVTGGAGARIFGDVRAGHEGPQLSVGEWPYLSVYRLMHEGQYRLPTDATPAQACEAKGISGRPGIALIRIPQGEETRLALKTSKPPVRIF